MKHRAPAEENTPAAVPLAPAASVPLAPAAAVPLAPAAVPTAPAAVPTAPAAVPTAPVETLPPRPVPDLGFFAVPSPRGSGSSFGGGSSFSSPPAAQQRGTAPGRFDGVAGNQFGGAPNDRPFGSAELATLGAGAPPGFSAPSLQPKSGSFPGGRALVRIGGTLLVLVVLGAFGMGRFTWLSGFLAGDLTTPTSLAGLTRTTGLDEQERLVAESLEKKNSGDAIVASYGDERAFYTIVAQRVRIKIDRELADAGVAGQGRVVGESTCAVAQAVTICLRTSRSLSVVVFSSFPAEQTAAALDEAWDKV